MLNRPIRCGRQPEDQIKVAVEVVEKKKGQEKSENEGSKY